MNFTPGRSTHWPRTLMSRAGSVTSITVEPGRARYRATSSKGMWVPPFMVAVTPGSVPMMVMSFLA